MLDPLDLTIQPVHGPFVQFGSVGILVPSMEASLVPLWRTRDELDVVKEAIATIEDELVDELNAA